MVKFALAMEKYLRQLQKGVIALATAMCIGASAQGPVLRPVTSFYTIEAGSCSMTDTYLSPLQFSGWHLGIGYQRLQAMKFSPDRWVMELKGDLSVDRATPEGLYRAMWGAEIDLSWAMMARWQLPVAGLAVAAGGNVEADMGVLYIDRGGNNPASAKAAITIGAIGSLTYNFHLGSLPITARWEPLMPLIGACFSPDYDELYYEIYLGNRHGLVHAATPFNRFAMTNTVSIDLHLGDMVLRVGYRNKAMSSGINHLTTNWSSNSLVFGLGGEWLSAGAVRGMSADTRIISAIY